MHDDETSHGVRPNIGWVPLAHGVQVAGGLQDDLTTTLRAWQLALPPLASFTSLTSTVLRGWWIPPLPLDLPVFVAAGPTGRINRAELDVCRHRPPPPWEAVRGLRLATPAETLLACARDLGLLDVVCLGDAALGRGDVTKAQLRRVAAQRRRGAPLLRRAIPFMDGRVESIYETLLRMLLVVCGVPVEPQFAVIGTDGSTVARADLHLCGTTDLVELDGGHHREARQQRLDLARDRRIIGAGYVRRGYTSHDVLFRGFAILRDADAALGRDHVPGRIDAWHDLLLESLFTPSGHTRLRARLALPPETADESVS